MPTLSSTSCADSRLKKELTLTDPVSRGKSKKAKLVQELLAINGINVAVDGDYGEATQAALDVFCQRQGLPESSTVGQALMDQLAQPLLRATRPVKAKASLAETIVATAKQHVAEHPIEVGGPNAGPWVRLYMRGLDGKDYLWCAGFVSYIVAAAADAHGQKPPVSYTFSCDALATEAKSRKKFVKRTSPSAAPPGSIFLVPSDKNAADWIHTGIIIGANATGNVFRTIEGNTNEGGSRNGFEACERFRACGKVDVVRL